MIWLCLAMSALALILSAIPFTLLVLLELRWRNPGRHLSTRGEAGNSMVQSDL